MTHIQQPENGTPPVNRRFTRRFTSGVILLAAFTTHPPRPASAEVTSVTGSALARIEQSDGTQVVQSDFAQEIVPQTKPAPPATAFTELSQFNTSGQLTAEAHGIAHFTTGPAFFLAGPPNDVGFDFSSVSTDTITQWDMEGEVTVKRSIVLHSNDLVVNLGDTTPKTVSSRLILSGILLIGSMTPDKDLTGVYATLEATITQVSPSQGTTELFSLNVQLDGGPAGGATATQDTGEGSAAATLLDFSGPLTAPVAWAVVFAGAQFPYEYKAIADEPFELELVVRTTLHVEPGDTFSESVFGQVQEGLPIILGRIREDDRGQALVSRISQAVDTTGLAYSDDPAAGATALFRACGLLGPEALLGAAGAAMMIGARRRRR